MGGWPQEAYAGTATGILSNGDPLLSFADKSGTQEGGFDATGTAWVTAAKAVFSPVHVPKPITVTDAVYEAGVTITGDIDIGLYTWAGGLIVSTGALAIGATGIVVAALANTAVAPGWYHLACSVSTNTPLLRCTSAGTTNPGVSSLRMDGFQTMAAAHPLPATATFAILDNTQVPLIGLAYRAVA